MKRLIVVGAVALVLIGLVAGVSFYRASLAGSADSSSEPTESPTSPVSGGQLKINNLAASSDGRVSFNVTLCDGDFMSLEAVEIGGANYSWSEGSSESAIILEGQTKYWSKDVGVLKPSAEVEVVVQANPEGASGITMVDALPNPGTPSVPEAPGVPGLADYLYDYYSGVGLFNSGIHVIATSQNPLTQLQTSEFPTSYWALMRENVTNLATDQDFVSILISRGDRRTGGYTLQVEAFSLLESYPAKLRFNVNFTDPGEGILVSQAFTNPLVLVPIGNLSPGKYEVEVHIVQYILTFDEQGKPNYRPVMTLKEEVWTQTLTITGS